MIGAIQSMGNKKIILPITPIRIYAVAAILHWADNTNQGVTITHDTVSQFTIYPSVINVDTYVDYIAIIN